MHTLFGITLVLYLLKLSVGQGYHFFKPVNSNAYKRTADDDALASSFNITGEACFGRMTTESLRLNKYGACRYNEK